MLPRLSLSTRVFPIFAGLAAGAQAALVIGLWLGFHRLGSPEALNGFVQAGMVAGLAMLGLFALVWYMFDVNVARPIDTLAGALRARAHADAGGDVDTAVARYLGDLAPAATAAATSLREARSALAESVARESLRWGEEKARLESLLAHVPVGVPLCVAAHQIVFYNAPAAKVLGAGPGLGLQKLTDYLREGPLQLA